jgi:hypothetical protein
LDAESASRYHGPVFLEGLPVAGQKTWNETQKQLSHHHMEKSRLSCFPFPDLAHLSIAHESRRLFLVLQVHMQEHVTSANEQESAVRQNSWEKQGTACREHIRIAQSGC